MSVDFSKIWNSKRAMRERLRALPVADKLRMLDAMRGSVVSIRAAKPAQGPKVHEAAEELQAQIVTPLQYPFPRS